MPAKHAAWRIGGALLLGFAAALPLALHGASCGQDFDFHLQSWLAVRAAWHTHHLVPHWVAWANYGAGEPRFTFYPPLSWLLGALLSFLLPWTWVPWAFTVLCGACAACSMRRAASGVGAGSMQAWLAAALYALSPYLLFCAYERGALAELLAALWFPPLFIALLRAQLPVPRIALLVAALWFTNAPSAVMGCYLVLFALAWRSGAAMRAHSLVQLWLRGAAAVALGCALAGDYLLPAWFDERYVTIRRAVGPGMRIRDSFLFEHTGAPYHDQVLHTASVIAVVTLAAGLGFAALFFARRHVQPLRSGSPGPAAFLTAVLLACALLELRPSEWLWTHLPQLGFLQFPWRLLLPASAAAALLFGLLVQGLAARRARIAATACVALTGIALVAWADRTRFQPCDDEDNVRAQLVLPTEDQGGFEGTDEYGAAGSDNGEIQQGLPPVRLLNAPDADEGDDGATSNPDWKPNPPSTVPGRVAVTQWTTDLRAVTLRPDAPAYAVLRLERFPSWQVTVDGRPCGSRCIQRDDGLLTISLPAGRTATVLARWHTGGATWAGRAVTAAAAALLLLAGVAARRRQDSSAPLS